MSGALYYDSDMELLLRPREVRLPERLAKECWWASSG